MLASGQMGNEFKRRYIKQNKDQKSDNLPNSYLPKDSTTPADLIPQDTFKTVRHRMLLNQSAMTPNKTDNANQKLDDLASKSDQVLLKVSTVFPFTWFINEIIIDPYKVNIIFREFFWSEHIHSIMIKDILDIVVESSIFFATIRIVDQGYFENTVDVAYLKKDDALMVRKIVQGLVIAHRQAVDLSTLSRIDIKNKTEELGKVKGFDTETQT